MIRTTASAISSRAADWPIARPSEKLCRPIPVAMKTRELLRGREAAEAAAALELRRRGGARAEHPARALALHPRVVPDEAEQARREADRQQQGEPREPAAVAVLERRLDRVDRGREDVPEQEEQDAGRGRG